MVLIGWYIYIYMFFPYCTSCVTNCINSPLVNSKTINIISYMIMYAVHLHQNQQKRNAFSVRNEEVLMNAQSLHQRCMVHSTIWCVMYAQSLHQRCMVHSTICCVMNAQSLHQRCMVHSTICCVMNAQSLHQWCMVHSTICCVMNAQSLYQRRMVHPNQKCMYGAALAISGNHCLYLVIFWMSL